MDLNVGKYTYSVKTIDVLEVGAEIVIGAFCSIAPDFAVILGNYHRTDWITTFPFGHIHQDTFDGFDGVGHPTTNGNVTIGNDVWIGRAVTVMSGVTIGDGAVIAANSHVVKDVEPYTIVGGNPAQHVRYRFSKEVIQTLLRIKWWTWDDAKINRHLRVLCHAPTVESLAKLEFAK